MKNGLYKYAYITLVLLLVIPFVANARTFLRTLRAGDAGEDVRFVQKILNLSPLTQIAQTGIGSPGFETVFFGQATKNALIKFQNLYASDVLKPAGLSVATGVAGLFTQKKINELDASYQASIKERQKAQDKIDSSAKISVSPYIESLSPLIFGAGDTIQIKGRNFDAHDNTVLLSIENNNKFTGISSSDTKNLSIPINNLIVSDTLTKGFGKLSGDTRSQAIAYLIQKGQFSAGLGDGSAYMSAFISIKNKNGTSNSIRVQARVINK